MSNARELPGNGGGDEGNDEVEEHRMPLLDHLRELRNRLMWSVAAIGVGMLVSLAFVDEIIAFITAPVEVALQANDIEGGLAIVNSPFEGIYTWLRAAFLGAMALSSPMVAYQLWQFVAPGLYKTERRIVLPLAASSTALFLGGAAFAYYVIFPFAFPFFFTIIETEVSLSLEGYLSAVIRMMLAFGICFQLPVATYFLAKMGLIDHRDMITGFRYAVIVIFVVSAIITPPDVLTQSLLAMPLIVLYGVGIVVAWLTSTKER